MADNVQTLTVCEPELSGQAVLFEEFQEQPQLVEATKVFLHTGKITSKNEGLCEAIITAYATGLVSQRQIAKRLGVGRETVKTIIHLADQAGKLGPLKQRLSKKISGVLELTLDTLSEMLADGRVPANVLPIVYGVLSDKKALLDADFGGADLEAAPRVTAEMVRERFERMRRATVESESTVLPGESLVAATPGANGTAQAPVALEGGGGDGGGRAGREGEGLRVADLQAKESHDV